MILYIVMPSYNEEANIESVVAQWHPIVEKLANESRLLIVNDGSTDNSSKVLAELQQRYPLLIVIEKTNSGHGATCLFAYRKAIESKADYIFQTDSDGQTNPAEFWRFWENIGNYDFIFGSRTSRQDGIGRIFVSRMLRLVGWIIFGVWVKDANTPFRLMKTERLIPILKLIPEDFFLSNVIISTIAVKWKERSMWFPISFKPRLKGKSSINFKRIIKIGMKSMCDFKMINNNLSLLQNGPQQVN